MYIITLILLSFLALGWLSLITIGKKPFLDVFFHSLLTGGILAGVLFVANLLKVDIHTLLLFGIAVGSTTFRAKYELYDNTLLLLFFGIIGYLLYLNGVLNTIILIILSAVVSFIVQRPLVEMPYINKKATVEGSLTIAYVLGLVAYCNILLLYFIYGI